MRTQTRALTSPSDEHRHVEGERIVWRIGQGLAGIEGAARRAADESAGAELLRQSRGEEAGPDGAVLKRGGLVVELDQPRETLPDLADKGGKRVALGRNRGRRRRAR